MTTFSHHLIRVSQKSVHCSIGNHNSTAFDTDATARANPWKVKLNWAISRDFSKRQLSSAGRCYRYYLTKTGSLHFAWYISFMISCRRMPIDGTPIPWLIDNTGPTCEWRIQFTNESFELKRERPTISRRRSETWTSNKIVKRISRVDTRVAASMEMVL